MKTLTIKLPLSIAQSLDDRGALNPKFVSDFLSLYIYGKPVSEDDRTPDMLFTYSFKVDEHIHAMVKDEAAKQGLSIVEFVRRLFEENYL